jgi:hypothetical protein
MVRPGLRGMSAPMPLTGAEQTFPKIDEVDPSRHRAPQHYSTYRSILRGGLRRVRRHGRPAQGSTTDRPATLNQRATL